MAAFLLLIASLPLLSLGLAFVRGLFLFWPVMILLGAVHSHIAWVPALGWQATFLVVALLTLLLPSDAKVNTD